MATQAQVDANRRNATKSTGPKTDEGKASSRANAVTHGMTASVVVPKDQETAKNQRFADWFPSIAPEDKIQEFELDQAVMASLRIEHCQAIERDRRIELAEIATDQSPKWDLDRNTEAAALGKTLKRDPELTMLQLRGTPAGRSWLINQWRLLLTAVPADGKSKWTNAESNRYLDLMGMARFLRESQIAHFAAFNSPVETRGLILAAIAELESEQVNMAAEVAKIREKHVQGLIDFTDAKLKLFRRYEMSAQRQYNKSIAMIRKAKAVSARASRTKGEPQPAAEPTQPSCETKPIPVPATEKVVVAQAEAPLPGNRRYRRKLQKDARHQAHLAKRSA